MAHPFGGHPTLERFVEWVCENGCTAEPVVRARASGQAYVSLEITSESGARLAIPRPDMNKRLIPSVVSHYQRRLGIKTPFSAMPEEEPQGE